ncbi:DEAD/DEAH box helicase [Sulfolobus sp. S-194]|uniref:DEAD/DEAH box helicase n=1 Tax=Sulfolobus sp. S-194 TaxID=2512240 RepID=UPI0014371EA4|nr:DEAD/DEAH box helicase [Sulfolobus sp. S-194]QIW22849.1 DEAD/DEAH box helicase [Sulfolobus sp. S-194]
MADKELIIPETFIPLGNLAINGKRLRKFQEDLYYALEQADEVCITAPTGSGKTFSLLILLAYALKTRLPVVGIYPSKALINDQFESLSNTLLDLGFQRIDNYTYRGKFSLKNLIEKDIKLYLVKLTHDTKKDVMDIIENFYAGPNKYIIILTVPEYPYIYLTNLGLIDAFSTLAELVSKRTTITHDDTKRLNVSESLIKRNFNLFARTLNGYYFIDEFHLYTGFARASLLTLKRMIEDYNEDTKLYKFVFSSATPIGIECKKVVSTSPSDDGAKIRKRTRVVFHLASGNPQEEAVNYIVNNFKSSENRKTGIILDRIYYIAQLCDKIQDATVVWGLKNYGKCRISQNPREEKIIIGNSAISFGIDIPNLDLGFIHAHDAETAIQRIGRFGRHGEGEAEVHLFIKSTYKVTSKIKCGNMKYDEFLKLIREIYEKREDDGLDKIKISKERAEVAFYTYKLFKMIATGEIETQNLTHQNLPTLIKLRPIADEYFYVYAFRPGGITGRWCNGNGQDDFFSMARNFEYDPDNQCFKDTPLKQLPEVLVQREVKDEHKFLPVEKFSKLYFPRLVINNRNNLIKLDDVKDLKNSYVLVIKHEDVNWKDFDEMARIVASYESAFPMCNKENRSFDPQKLRCITYDGLLVFI